MSTPLPQAECDQFLRTLWHGTPSENYFLIWTLPDKKSRWFRPTDEGLAAAVAAIGQIRDRGDVYVGVGLADQDRGAHRRTVAREITGIPGLWLDVDVQDESAHKKPNLPKTQEDALALLRDALPDPTVIIDSGHGLQAWWLFDRPWIFASANERAAAAQLAQAWNDTLRAVAHSKGMAIDATHDLSRVMRVPGTANRKGLTYDPPGPVVPCRLVSIDSDLRYTTDELRTIVGTPPTAPIKQYDGTGGPMVGESTSSFSLRRDAEPPFRKWEALKRVDRNIVLTWERKRRDLGDQSASGYDMALANYAALAGWDDQEIVDLLVYARVENGDDPKLDRADYYARTLRKARDSAARAQAGDAIDTVLDELKHVDPEDEGSVHKSQQALLDWLTPIFRIGVLKCERYAQDPALFRLQTEHGWVVLGTAEDVLNQNHVRGRLLDVTKTVVPRVKNAEWDKVAEAVIRSAVDVDMGPEPTLVGSVTGWLDDYLEAYPPLPEKDESAIVTRNPFMVGGHVCIFPKQFRDWLNRYDGEKMTTKELTMRLKIYGADPIKVNATVEGRPTSRSVWKLPIREQDPT